MTSPDFVRPERTFQCPGCNLPFDSGRRFVLHMIDCNAEGSKVPA